MRKKKLSQCLVKNDILDIIHEAQMIILKYVNNDKIIFIINEYTLQNKKPQIGILFEVFYRQKGFLSWFFPYNKKYVINISEDYIIKELAERFLFYVVNNTSDEFEQLFILEHIDLFLNKINNNDDKIQFLKDFKKYFIEKYQFHINSLILLYTL